MLSLTILKRRMARAGSSLRNVMKTAVLMAIGVGTSPAAAYGATAPIGSVWKCSNHRPITEFQNPTTVHGVPKAKQTNMIMSITVHPPAERTCAATPSIATHVTTLSTASVIRRRASSLFACSPVGTVRLAASAIVAAGRVVSRLSVIAALAEIVAGSA